MNLLKTLPAGLAGFLAAPVAAWAQQTAPGYGGGYGHHPHMWGGEWGWGGMFLGPVFGILFIAAIAIAVVLVIRALGGRSAARGGGGTSAFDILDEHFARGEIDREEYEERKRVLSGG
jgi:putative membrane protein